VSQCQLAHHRRHQHTTSWRMATTISCTLMHIDYGSCTVSPSSVIGCSHTSGAACTSRKYRYGRPPGRTQPLSQWGRQPQHHQAPAQEAPQHRGSSPRGGVELSHSDARSACSVYYAFPLLSQNFEGVHGTRFASLYGGLATQVLTPPIGEVLWDCQSRQVPTNLLHLHPCCRRG
jgi:hypothetical protein